MDVEGKMAESRALKRKASPTNGQSSKKARHTENNVANHSLAQEADGIQDPASVAEAGFSDSGTDDYSSTNSEDESDQHTTSNTPLTPFSPKASPRFPSELKTHLCTFPDCGKAFNRPAKLQQHILSHTNSRPFVCPHQPCTKDFFRQSHLKHHIKSAHSNIRDHVCDWEGCGKSFITATRLKRHHAAHEGREKFKCSVYGCGQTFRKHGTLQKHILTAHEGRKAYECEVKDESGIVCGQGFDTLGKLHAHEGRVHGGKRFWCCICSPDPSVQRSGEDAVAFSTYAELQEHIKVDHPPHCDVCGQVCNSQRDLKSHVEVRHGKSSLDERKTHLCPEPNCGRAFTKKGNLNVHIQSAHKAKKYICGQVDLETLNRVEGWNGLDACGRALSTKGSLENHIRTAHLGLGRRRSQSATETISHSARKQRDYDLNITKLTGVGYEHYSGRHISCLFPECQFRFSRAYDLQIHLKMRHNLSEHEAKSLTTGVNREFDGKSANYSTSPDDLMQDVGLTAPQMMLPRGYGSVYEEEITHGGRFWAGDVLGEAGEGDDEWFQDEMEMRRLVDDEIGVQGWNEAAASIDPLLR